MIQLLLTNSLSKQKERFQPVDINNIRMYVCGPTVYERPHLGNARSAVIYDVLFRLLKILYPKVTYVRNITDVDDKIIDAAARTGENINDLTARITQAYHADMDELNCLTPTTEPRATDHITHMVKMIELLIAKKHAYVIEGHVLFSVSSYHKYGSLAKRSIEEMIAGARIEVAPFKRHPADFVLWKPVKEHEVPYSFKSPWGIGRPGWHIECSAMSIEHLGNNFDIHGGGADLMFPHHENEIAQSCCALPGSEFAKYWVHNGFLTVNNDKMSKSLGNFRTVRELIDNGISGTAIRYFYLTSHYRKPLDFNIKAITDAEKAVAKLDGLLSNINPTIKQVSTICATDKAKRVLNMIADDINTPGVLAYLHLLMSEAATFGWNESLYLEILFICNILGLLPIRSGLQKEIPHEILKLAKLRMTARKQHNWTEADRLRAKLVELGYEVVDSKDSYTLRYIRK